ncbi:MAG: hypothetical protein ABWY82_00735 [Tardiphaga sp.]
MSKIKQDLRPLGHPQSWAATNGTYLSGQAAIDGADAVAIAMEARWGAGRLRLLVPVELREKFDRQRFLFDAAIWHGDLPSVQREAERMITAWQALARAAEAAGAPILSPEVWEVSLADGTVVALVRSPEEAHAVVAEGRRVTVYTLAELAIMLENYQEVTKVKVTFPGAEVVSIRRDIDDPLLGIRDGVRLEDTFNDDLPAFGN